LRIAAGDYALIAEQGYLWTLVISGVIFTTMSVQDLQDEDGDAARGRLTVPLAFGSITARKLLACFVAVWSFVCSFFWSQSLLMALLPLSFGSFVVLRLLYRRGDAEDTRTWRAWCLWCAVLYILPCVSKLFDV
jgi:1,4-dihydroxy-2-naphthoate octaprenyltransferase